MAKVRQDAWSHEDDLLLAETVLRHIREGSTQLNAFEEVGDALNRTSAACGFRWNAEVRNKYISAIDLAKRQRKDKKRAQASHMKKNHIPFRVPQQEEPMVQNPDNTLIMEPPELTEQPKQLEITMDHVIHYLQSFQSDHRASNQLKLTLERTEKENKRLHEEITSLEKELSSTNKRLETVEEDYKMFIQIIERARKMAVLDDQGVAGKTPTFKMDKNGNLEQMAQGSSN